MKKEFSVWVLRVVYPDSSSKMIFGDFSALEHLYGVSLRTQNSSAANKIIKISKISTYEDRIVSVIVSELSLSPAIGS